MFVDADLAGENPNRRRQTGIFIFINKASINWYSKRQETVEEINFGSDFCAMNTGAEMVDYLRYKIRMIRVPIDGSANDVFQPKTGCLISFSVMYLNIFLDRRNRTNSRQRALIYFLIRSI